MMDDDDDGDEDDEEEEDSDRDIEAFAWAYLSCSESMFDGVLLIMQSTSLCSQLSA